MNLVSRLKVKLKLGFFTFKSTWENSNLNVYKFESAVVPYWISLSEMAGNANNEALKANSLV